MKYDIWVTKDGRRLEVVKMTDNHVIHTIRAIEERRIFPSYGGGLFLRESVKPFMKYMPDDAIPFALEVTKEHQVEYDEHRNNWLTSLKGEALRRGLDWSVPPSRKVGLCSIICGMIGFRAGGDTSERIRACLTSMGIPEPEVDICNRTNKVLYLHWKAGENVGTPLDR